MYLLGILCYDKVYNNITKYTVIDLVILSEVSYYGFLSFLLIIIVESV
jgi:hypothetical protein